MISRERKRLVLRAFLATLGVGLVAFLVWRAGPAEIAADLKRAGWGFGWLLLVAVLWRVIAGFGMWVLFDRDSVSWWSVFIVRTGGEAINTLTPLMNFGGEPIKVAMLRRHVSLDIGASALVLDKTMTYLASIFVMIVALVMGLFLLAGNPIVFGVTVGLITVLTTTVGYLAYRQTRGDLVYTIASLIQLSHLRLRPETLEMIERIDINLSNSWRTHRSRLVASLAIHFFGRSLRAFDVLLCAGLLGLSLDFTSAYFVAGVAMMVNTAFAFVPGQLGASEGGHAYVIKLLGIGVASGVSISLLRRFRDWTLALLILPFVVFYPNARRVEATRKH